MTTKKPRVNFLLSGPTHGVDGLPRDQHGHDGGLAGAGGQLQRQAHQFGVGIVVGIGEVFEELSSGLASCGRDFGQPNGGLNRLDLAEEWPDAAELVVPPMLQQAGGFRRDVPSVWIRQCSPFIHFLANRIDDDCRFLVFLLLG